MKRSLTTPEINKQSSNKPNVLRRSAVAFTGALALIGIGCSTSPTTTGNSVGSTTTTLPETCTIDAPNLAIGDSITTGYGGVASWAERMPITIDHTSAALGGLTISQMETLAIGQLTVCQQERGDAVEGTIFINGGANDFGLYSIPFPVTDTYNNMQHLISSIQALGETDIHVIATTPFRGDIANRQVYVDQFNRLGAGLEPGVPGFPGFIDCTGALKDPATGLLQTSKAIDRVHHNNEGAQDHAECIAANL